MVNFGYFENATLWYRGTGRHILVWLTGTLLIAALWMASRPYEGAIGDAQLYAVEALRLLLPGHFDDDLYFRSGSQGQFTLFPRIYAPFLARFGVGGAALRLTVVFQAAWVGGLAFFVFSLFRDNRERFLAIVAVILFPCHVIQGYGEAFLTPRLPAEALVLWGLGFMMREKLIRSTAFLVAALMLHPLTALSAIALLALRLALQQPRWWWLWGILGGGGLVAAAAGILPFALLFVQFDPEWFKIVSVRNAIAVPAQWNPLIWARWASMLATAGLGLAVARVPERRLILGIFVVAFGGFVLTVFGSGLLHDILITDIQQYRASWLLLLISNMILGGCSSRCPWKGRSSHARLFLGGAFVMLVASGITDFVGVAAFAAAPTILLAAVTVWWEERSGKEIPIFARFLGAIIFGACVGCMLIMLFLLYGRVIKWPDYFIWTRKVVSSISIAGIIFIYFCRRHRFVGLASAIAIIAVAILASKWDQREPWTALIENNTVNFRSLAELLPDDGQIYWEGDVRVPWLALQRASYFSCVQGGGVLFHRRTALDHDSRFGSFAPMGTLDFRMSPFCVPSADQKPVPLTRALLRQVCHENPPLSALVLVTAVADAPGTVWQAPAPFTGMMAVPGGQQPFSVNTFHIYACRDQ